MTNPLLTVTYDIPFDRIQAEHVEPATDRLLKDAQRAIDGIVAAEAHRTYDNTVAALERATEPLEWASGIVDHLESVSTTPALREAYERIQPHLSTFWSGVLLNEGLWRALQDYAATPEAVRLGGPHRRHLNKLLAEFRRQGADLDQADKDRIAEINLELATLTTKFSQQVLDATNEFELIVDDEARLAGLPESAREAARESARAKGVDGWRFTLQAPSLTPILTYLDDEGLREAMWRGHNARATREGLDNRPIVRRILTLRGQKARMLGYRDYADLVLEDRMAERGEVARRFVAELHAKTRAAFERENTELQTFRDELEGRHQALQPWDISYYAEKQRQRVYHFDEEELRPYLPADRVLEGLFETTRRLYGVAVEPAEGMAVWNPAVQTYRLLDEDGTHLASFYVDLYPREDKRGGAWMDALITAVPPERHLGLFCANVNPPVGDKPALLTHREVETLFHEFGHLMHLCLSRVPVRSLAGTNVPWDFVELPSQVMENWCWEREALDLFARHHETDEPIPDGLFEKMNRARTFRAANAQMRQLGFAAVDLGLHCDYDPDSENDVAAYARDIIQAHHPAPLPRDYGFIAGFTHLFSSPVGYAAGYYSYKWAEVLDADAFTRFRECGVFDRAVGQAFRDAILSQGDSRPPMESYRAFMGRDPAPEPLLARQGLLSAS